MKKDEVDRILPPTVDELEAEDENLLLNKNIPVEVTPEQHHVQHLEILNKAEENAASLAHGKAHRLAIKVFKVRPDLFPQMIPQAPPIEQPGSSPVSPATETISPSRQSAPVS